ncbi:hypothetical protein B551_0207045 [Cupriavidus sp. HPC(L)]|uniref:DUF4123 domain-containing protein n=1 Tax=Cupriavidus sp. HPC(L) TaxID=1217418 RepID=UPI0002910977|nr:DUF4123 domain-containing protein [Cupriavidus sp. HPC(L)]ESJ23475.1 hypothetical protein B551_0207045 [Cupriavidus sp. HPC(L)]
MLSEPRWVDDYPVDFLSRLQAAFGDASILMLVDCGFDTGFVPALHRRFPETRIKSLFEGLYEGPGLAEVAPQLVELPNGESLRTAMLELALRRANAKPMLTFLHWPDGFDACMHHLRGQLEAVDSSDTAFLIRIADTRALQQLLLVLDEEQRTRVLGKGTWRYADRSAELQCVRVRVDAQVGSDGPLRLSDRQVDDLASLARADAVLTFIQRSTHIFGRFTGRPSEAHSCISKVLREASPESHDAEVYRSVLAVLEREKMLSSTSEVDALFDGKSHSISM